MPRVFSYERVSSRLQAKSGKGLERQSGDAEAWCAAHGVELDQSLQLTDPGRSAFRGDHLQGALGEFLRLARSGELGDSPTLLVEAIDRLSRLEPLDGLQDVLLALVRAGVAVVTLEDGAEYSRNTLRDDSSKLIVLTVKAQAAHDFSKRLSRRIKATWDEAYAELEAGNLPRGKVFIPAWCKREGDTVTLLPERAAVVRRIFTMAVDDGHSVIARTLNAERIPPFNGRPTWSEGAVKTLLKDIRVIGTIVINDQERLSERNRLRRGPRSEAQRLFPDLLPLAITPEEWEAAQAAIRRRDNPEARRGRKIELRFLGQGISRCRCGASIGTYSTRSGKARTLLRYVGCRHQTSHKDGCRSRTYRLDSVNGHILVRLHQGQLQQLLSQDSQRGPQILAEQQAVERLRAQLLQAEDAQANASRLFKAELKKGSVDALFREAVEEARMEVELKRTALSGAQQRLAVLRQEVNTEEFDQAVAALFDAFATGADTPEQRKEINRLMQRSGIQITLDNEERRIGMSIGEGPIDWQPLDPAAVQAALGSRTTSARFKDLTITAESAAALAEAFPSDPGWAEWLKSMEGVKQTSVTSLPPGWETGAAAQAMKEFAKAIAESDPALAEALKAMGKD